MIYGGQHQPKTGNMNIAAYQYTGDNNTLMTVVNVDTQAAVVYIALSSGEKDSNWKDIITGDVFKAEDITLSLPMEGSGSENHGLRVMARIDR